MWEAAPVGTPGYSITRYVYQGQTVFYVPAQCCDGLSALLDSCGQPICAPDGGLSGAGDGQCPDFFDARTDEMLVWSDPRNP